MIVASKQECLFQVSQAGIASGARFRRITRVNEIEFACQRAGCAFCVLVSQVEPTEQFPDLGEPLWTITTTGDHVHDPTEDFTPVPLPEHLRSVTAQQAALGLSGAALASAVSAILHTPVATHITRRIENKFLKLDSTTCWKKLVPMLDLLHRRGFPTRIEPIAKDKPNSVRFCYVETPYAKSLVKSSAFVGVAFLDGAHTTSTSKSTMLAVCTVTGDHMIMPLAFGERSRATLFSDGHAAIAHAMEVFELDLDEHGNPKYDYVQAPCLHHMMKKMKSRRAFRDLVRTDHRTLFEARLQEFQDSCPREYERSKDVIQKMSYKGTDSIADRCFGFIADSPIESLNAALKEARHEEPFYLIQAFLQWSLRQRETQLAKLPEDNDALCASAVTIMRRREASGKGLAVQEIGQSQYVVTDAFSSRISLQYTVTVRNGAYECHCGEYARSGLPCMHIYAVDSKFPGLGVPAAGEFYKAGRIREGLRATATLALPAMDDLEELDTQAPVPARRPGRPRSHRMRPLSEHLQFGHKLKRHCGYCGELCHHDKRTCPKREEDEAAAEKKKRGRGRPKRTRSASPGASPPAVPAKAQRSGRRTRSPGATQARSPSPMATRRSHLPMATRHRSPR